jgi:glycosyltransferase involved in cell wall biosynthesis
MKISIVTISYNQVRFLEQAMNSVLAQDWPNIEYIVVDAGSTDGSRDLIQKYHKYVDQIIFEPDDGPAAGLNKGFHVATGEIMGFLNSDDLLLPGALATVAQRFAQDPDIDVISGHALIVDKQGCVVRKSYSDRFSLQRFAYGACVVLQPSTFFRRRIYEMTGGFNQDNHVSWDGELFLDMGLKGGHFAVINTFLSAFRVHADSLTGSKKLEEKTREYDLHMFNKIMSRDKKMYDYYIRCFYKFSRWILNPLDVWERILHGRIYGRASRSR